VLLALFLMGWGTSAFAVNRGVVLSWDAPVQTNNIVEYLILYGIDTTNLTQTITTIDPDAYDGTVINGLPSGHTYYFAVISFDSANNSSPLSEEVSITLPTPLPPNLSPQFVDDGFGNPYGVYISWTNSTSTDWYFQYSTDMFNWSNYDSDHSVEGTSSMQVTEFYPLDPTEDNQIYFRVVDY
jgi:hypothetical protein